MKKQKCPVCDVEMSNTQNDIVNNIQSLKCCTNESDLCGEDWNNGCYIFINGKLEKGWNHQNLKVLLTIK